MSTPACACSSRGGAAAYAAGIICSYITGAAGACSSPACVIGAAAFIAGIIGVVTYIAGIARVATYNAGNNRAAAYIVDAVFNAGIVGAAAIIN
eukprot:16445011-Heterocapsa_arctica.AAC.1